MSAMDNIVAYYAKMVGIQSTSQEGALLRQDALAIRIDPIRWKARASSRLIALPLLTTRKDLARARLMQVNSIFRVNV